jgi:glycerol kinase
VRYPTRPEAPDALSDGVYYLKALGQYDAAIDATRQYIKLFGAKLPAEAATAAYGLVSIYQARGDEAALRSYLTAFVGGPHARHAKVEQLARAHLLLGESLWKQSCPVALLDGVCARRVTSAPVKTKAGLVAASCAQLEPSRPARPAATIGAGRSAARATPVARPVFRAGPPPVRWIAVPRDVRLRKAALAAFATASKLAATAGDDDATAGYVRAQAELRQRDSEFEDVVATPMPTKLDFDPAKPAAIKASTERFTAWYSAQQAAIGKLKTGYLEIVALRDGLSSIEAGARIGDVARWLAVQLRDAEIPALQRSIPEAAAAYCDALASVVSPIEELARSSYTACVELSRKLDVWDAASARCGRELGPTYDLTEAIAATATATAPVTLVGALEPPELIARSLALPPAIDQGTTGTTVLVLDEQLAVRGRGYQEFPQIYPQPGWVEHDPDAIWAARSPARCRTALAGEAPASIAAIGITNQRETTVVWDRATGRRSTTPSSGRTAAPPTPARRSRPPATSRGCAQRTGLVLDPYFSGTKLAGCSITCPALRARAERGELAVRHHRQLPGPPAHRRRRPRHRRDQRLAHAAARPRTRSGPGPTSCCALLRVPRALLPEMRVGLRAEVYGVTQGRARRCPTASPSRAWPATSRRRCSARPASSPGEAKCTYGTGAFILMNTGEVPVPLAARPAHHRGVAAGAARPGVRARGQRVHRRRRRAVAARWPRRHQARAAEVEALAPLRARRRRRGLRAGLAGLGAPHWRPHARGSITGLTRGTTRAHLARATLEGIALQNTTSGAGTPPWRARSTRR